MDGWIYIKGVEIGSGGSYVLVQQPVEAIKETQTNKNDVEGAIKGLSRIKLHTSTDECTETEMPKSTATSLLRLRSGETISRTIPPHLICTQLGRGNKASILDNSVAKNTEDGYSRNRLIPNSDEVLECNILDRGAGKTSGI